MLTEPTYTPEWARPDNPTIGMSEAAARDFWKAHQTAGDCRFALRPGQDKPADLTAAWQALQARIDARGGAELPGDRKIAAQLRDCWRRWIAGMPYTVPEIAAAPVRKIRTALAPSIDWQARAIVAEAALAELLAALDPAAPELQNEAA